MSLFSNCGIIRILRSSDMFILLEQLPDCLEQRHEVRTENDYERIVDAETNAGALGLEISGKLKGIFRKKMQVKFLSWRIGAAANVRQS